MTMHDKAPNVHRSPRISPSKGLGKTSNEEMRLAGESDPVKSYFKQCDEGVQDAFKK